MGHYVRCNQKRFDCKMCKDGNCIALVNTEFPNKVCPFYKKKENNKINKNERK